MNAVGLMLAAVLSTGVEIPDGGVPMNNGGHQYTTRTEKRPSTIADEATYLKWNGARTSPTRRRASTTTRSARA